MVDMLLICLWLGFEPAQAPAHLTVWKKPPMCSTTRLSQENKNTE